VSDDDKDDKMMSPRFGIFLEVEDERGQKTRRQKQVAINMLAIARGVWDPWLVEM
jgi:hypothetical protein